MEGLYPIQEEAGQSFRPNQALAEVREEAWRRQTSNLAFGSLFRCPFPNAAGPVGRSFPSGHAMNSIMLQRFLEGQASTSFRPPSSPIPESIVVVPLSDIRLPVRIGFS